MLLSLKERILLLNILPAEGNIITLRIMQDLRRNLAPTEEEIKSVNLRTVDDKILWDNDFEVEVPIGEKATDVIVDSLKKLNRENKLTVQHISLYERFVEKKEVS